jgi:hypothetical protein
LEPDFVIELVKYDILQLFGKDYLSALLPKIIIELEVLIELMPTLSRFRRDEVTTLHILLEGRWAVVKVY